MQDVARTIQPPPAGLLRLTHDDYQLRTVDPNGNVKTVLTDADIATTYDGKPSNYSAPSPAAAVKATHAATFAGNDNNLTFSAKVAGGGGNDLVITLLDPSEADYSPMLVYIDENNDRKVCVNLETDSGDNSFSTAGTGNGEITVTAPDNGEYTLSIIAGSAQNALSAAYADGTVTVSLAMDGGTAAEWTITDAGTGADSLITITGPTGESVDPTQFDAVTFESKIPDDVSQSLSIDYSEWPNVIIWLPTDANGDVVPTACSAIATALEAAHHPLSAPNWTCVPAVADGDWDSYNAPQAASTPAVAAAPLTDGSNSATNVAAAIEAGTDFTATAGGTGVDDVVLAELLPYNAPFTGGGENYSITTTAAEVIAAIAGFPDAAALMTVALTGSDGGAGTGAGVVESFAEQTFTGGKDIGEDAAEVLGTPGRLGRTAIGFEDGESTVKSIWTAMKTDLTTFQDGWVKTFTGS